MSSRKSFVWLALTGLVAGAVGFYAGLFGLLAVSGPESPEWSPVVMTGGAGLLGGAVIGVAAGRPTRQLVWLAITTGLAGALLGLLHDSFEWTIVVGIALILGTATVVSAR